MKKKNERHIYFISVDVPPLDQLYDETREDATFDDIKWKLLAWIMSFSAEVISLVKKLPKNFLLISNTLLALVKVMHVNGSKIRKLGKN